ncbi:UNVERIFIED_CONTAM: acetyl esterase/lipase [Brevibacillus sp. OAP136]
MDWQEKLKKRVVYQIPGMEQADVIKDVLYKTAGDDKLTLDVYYPADRQKDVPLPAVILIHGDAPWEMLKTIKDGGQFVSWGQLAAANGLIGITFTHRASDRFQDLAGPMEDIVDLFTFVQEQAEAFSIDARRLVIVAFSAGGPTALSAVLQQKPEWLRGIVSYYALMDIEGLREHVPDAPEEWYSRFRAATYLASEPNKIPPILIVKAMLDSPFFNESIDRFVKHAEEAAVPHQLLIHPNGQHAFDVRDDDETSRSIIQETLGFIKQRLQSE